MATRKERFLAALDKIFSYNSQTSTPGDNGVAYNETYWFGSGGPFCFVNENGKVTKEGSSGEILHCYSADGKLLRRVHAIESKAPNEKLVLGRGSVEIAIAQQPDHERSFPLEMWT